MVDDAPIIENVVETIGGNLVCGDWVEAITGAIIVGPYCEYPRNQHPRRFMVTVSNKANYFKVF